MTLIIVHYHLRPGGIRRVIELATPHLVLHAPRPITRVVLATGQRAEETWPEQFASALPGVKVELFEEPAFTYLSEQRASPTRIRARIRRALNQLFATSANDDRLVWAHNLGVGRNLILSHELTAACARHSIPLVSHHHDWWFDNRWARWPELRRAGFRTLAHTAQAVFPPERNALHVAINEADAAILAKHFGRHALWLPNLAEPAPVPTAARVRSAHRWLQRKLAHRDAPVWLLPCRTLRRKNIAEALLLTRWLRPEAWLVVTGGASSAEELPYFQALENAAHQHHWRLRLGVLAGAEAGKPSVNELLAASEAVLLTSVQEGFGLPYLEAAAARRPLIARRLPIIAPDLYRFGFRFPQAYDELWIAPQLFDWRRETKKQRKLFRTWRDAMPASIRTKLEQPYLLASTHPRAVPFSRLTLQAQCEVLVHPAHESWQLCLDLNPFLATWRNRSAASNLSITPWPRAAPKWLRGDAYARKFFAALAAMPRQPRAAWTPGVAQSDFIMRKLDARNLHPILWNANP